MKQMFLGSTALVATTGLLFTGLSIEDIRNYERSPVLEPLKPIEERATILFGGDLMFDRSIRLAMEAHGDDYIFSCIRDLLLGADLVVANLEGPITSHPARSIGSKVGGAGNYTFTFPTSTAELLARHNIRVVNIGNNHILNFGREGVDETKQWLASAGVAYFGAPDPAEVSRIERVALRGIPFSFVNWNDWDTTFAERVVAQTRDGVEAGRTVVVFAHWGEEYVSPPRRVRELAHSFVDAGASLVIGTHPHVVQEHEFYLPAGKAGEGVPIYYSLGNFVFDQYWDESVRRGLLVRATFTPKGGVSVEEIPIDNQTDRRTCAV